MYTGLNNEEVLASRKKYGTNAITSKMAFLNFL